MKSVIYYVQLKVGKEHIHHKKHILQSFVMPAIYMKKSTPKINEIDTTKTIEKKNQQSQELTFLKRQTKLQIFHETNSDKKRKSLNIILNEVQL